MSRAEHHAPDSDEATASESRTKRPRNTLTIQEKKKK